MSLLKCPDCRSSVSDQAPACPQCGRPFAREASARRPAQVIEKTRKGWKALRALGWLLILLGIILMRSGRVPHDLRRAPVGLWIVGAGIACIITSKVGAWWYHG